MKKFKKTCGCGYETNTNKQSWTTCPECGDNRNWEFEYNPVKTLTSEKRILGKRNS